VQEPWKFWVTCIQCCGERSCVPTCGTKKELGMVCSRTLPLSSSHLQRMVPCWTSETLDPVNLVIVHWVSRRMSTKSSIWHEMHAEHWLLIPMSSESVSNRPERGLEAVLSCMANATNARAGSCLCLVMSSLIHDFMISNHWSMPRLGVVLASSPKSGCPEPWVASGLSHHLLLLSWWMASIACWTDSQGYCCPCWDH